MLRRFEFKLKINNSDRFSHINSKQSNYIEITIWYGCSAVSLLHILRTLFRKNTSGGLLLKTDKNENKLKSNVDKVAVNHRYF